MLRHEATHVESSRRPSTSPPTRNRDLVTLPPIVKSSLFDVQNPLLILDDAPKKDMQENSAGMVEASKVTTSPEVATRAKSVDNQDAAKIPKTVNHKKPLLPPGPPQKPTNKKAVKKQTNMSEAKNPPKPIVKAKPADISQEMQNQIQTLATNNGRGSLPKSIILPAQLKVTSNKCKVIKTDFKVDFKADEEERRRALIFRQALEYDEVKKRCDQLEQEIAKLEMEFGCNLEFGESEIKSEPVDVDQEMFESGGKEAGAGLTKEKAEKGEEEESKMQVDDDEKWEGGGERVPPGWKVSKGPPAGQTRKFQSPEGFVFETRFAVTFSYLLIFLTACFLLPF